MQRVRHYFRFNGKNTTWKPQALVCLLLVMSGCSREKAVAIKMMAAQLAEASSRIEESLRAYWAAYHPPTGATSEEEQYLNLAKYLAGRHDQIAAGKCGHCQEAVNTAIKAISDTRQVLIPGLKQVRDIERRTAAVNQAVARLEEGSYFAGPAVEQLESHLLLIAGDLRNLHDLIAEQDAITEAAGVEVGGYFDQAVANIIHHAGSKLPAETLARLIEEEVGKGFALRQSRRDARDELLGRIAATAGVAVELASRAGDYRSVQWQQLIGYARDLSALASSLELPEKYVTGASEALAKVESEWVKIEGIRKSLEAEGDEHGPDD